jgi:hypothetical protein
MICPLLDRVPFTLIEDILLVSGLILVVFFIIFQVVLDLLAA